MVGKLVCILDASAFIGGLSPFMISCHRILTCSSVVNELADLRSSSYLEAGLASRKLKVVDPESEFIERVVEEARRRGLHRALSMTDIEVLALALQEKSKGNSVIVYTDDQVMQSMCIHMELKWRGVRRRGVRKPVTTVVRCKLCGREYRVIDLEVCPLCGGELEVVRR
ncbi:MAG: hypothetical protein DRN99_00595 [Thermoproteota archaeon]|nr:MAG: hypothetical protein DRN99_00595 [Candidatus Korarchaeota archaeon]